MLEDIGKKAKAASAKLLLCTTQQKNAALSLVADALVKNSASIIEKNHIDIVNGRAAGLTEALLDRLMLNEERIRDIAGAMNEIIEFPDPTGHVISEFRHANGMLIKKISVPMGVVAVIYEARPNVTADSAALCLKSGSAAVLRGGKEAINSNIEIVRIIREAIESAGLTPDCVQLVEDTSRDSARALMTLKKYVDLLIPRGGAKLIKSVVENATVPVIETGAGVCHTYVDKKADLIMGAEILFNAKVTRPSVCNSCECALVHSDIADRFIPLMESRFLQRPVEFRADERAAALLAECVPASESDWGAEYNDFILNVKVVDSLDEAIEHIAEYGTSHSECIVTDDAAAAHEFLQRVDAAAVYHNVSTRFTDGGVFGLGAEIGISTQKLHARGPLGLRELATYKYTIEGEGQVR